DPKSSSVSWGQCHRTLQYGDSRVIMLQLHFELAERDCRLRVPWVGPHGAAQDDLSLLVIKNRTVGGAQAESRRLISGFYSQNCFIGGNRLGNTSDLLQRSSQQQIGLNIPGIRRHGLLKQRQRVLNSALFHQQLCLLAKCGSALARSLGKNRI